MSVSQIGLILLLACLVAMITRRLHLPYSVGLAAAGIGVATLGGGANLILTPELIYTVLLPPLIFEAALQMTWQPFRRDLLLTLTLAFPGTLISAALVAAGMHVLLGWGWLGAGMFGALIAATDPVSVIAAFKEMRVAPRLYMLVEAESLLNDGAAAVLFGLLLLIAEGQSATGVAILSALAWMVVGGVTVGLAAGGGVLLLAGRTDDHLVEITLTTIAGYGAFLVADHFRMSGVLASLAAGLVVGNVRWRGSISGPGRDHIISFWEYVAFLANSVIFILIGSHAALHAPQLFTTASAIALGLVLLGRALSVVPLCTAFAGSTLRVRPAYQMVLIWGGLRGALGLALALAVPASVPERQAIIVSAFAVVAFSVFVQALTMPWMIRGLGLRAPAPE
jgi:monovalent cation:H+ antiporter, CPA1 family